MKRLIAVVSEEEASKLDDQVIEAIESGKSWALGGMVRQILKSRTRAPTKSVQGYQMQEYSGEHKK